MYLFRFLNTPLGGGGATQTFAPGGKYPRAATGSQTGWKPKCLIPWLVRIPRVKNNEVYCKLKSKLHLLLLGRPYVVTGGLIKCS